MAQEHGYCGCGHYANLTDGLCLRCHDDMSRMEDEGAPPAPLEEHLDALDDEWARERWEDDILEQQELEDFEGCYDEWDGNGYCDDSFPYYDYD